MIRIFATLAIAAALLVGCGESRQQKFERALREAEEARVDLEGEREQVKQREASYEDAQKAAERAEADLEAARRELASANDRLDTARAEVLKWAPADMLPPEMGATLPNATPATGNESAAPAAEPAAID
jgi:uncharacterized protein HemX